MPITEIATIPLVAGTAIGDPANQGSAVVKDIITTLRQQEGYQDTHFGMQIESPDQLQMLFSKSKRQFESQIQVR